MTDFKEIFEKYPDVEVIFSPAVGGVEITVSIRIDRRNYMGSYSIPYDKLPRLSEPGVLLRIVEAMRDGIIKNL